jgi:hypothetical protein
MCSQPSCRVTYIDCVMHSSLSTNVVQCCQLRMPAMDAAQLTDGSTSLTTISAEVWSDIARGPNTQAGSYLVHNPGLWSSQARSQRPPAPYPNSAAHTPHTLPLLQNVPGHLATADDCQCWRMLLLLHLSWPGHGTPPCLRLSPTAVQQLSRA